MKKIIVFVALFLSVALGVQAELLYTSTQEELVTGGVTLKTETRFYGDYALGINLITADLKDKNLGFELLKASGGCDKTATVTQFAKSDSDTVIAINGDFFSVYKNNQNFSLGLEVKDGNLLQSHINPDMAAGFLKNGVLSFSYVDFKAELKMANGQKAPVAHINKPTDYYGALLLYTPEFNGGTSPYLPVGMTAVTVTDGIVTGKGVSLGGVIPIPQNGYILVIDDNMSPTLNHQVNLNDKLEISVSVTPSLSGVETAFGGGTLLLKEGKKTKITHNVSGNNPRSIIGTNADGTVIYMMTVDGRQTVSRGVTLSELADICLEMGMVNAINLDGGGSTALVGKTFENNTLHTINSPTENRKVINALAITSDATPGETYGVFARAEKDVVLAGDTVKLWSVPYDKNYNTPKSTTGSVTWTLPEGRGYIDENLVYYPEKDGDVTLDVYYNDKKTDSITIRVIGNVAGIVAPTEITLKDGKASALNGNVSVFDKNGNTAQVGNILLLNPVYGSSAITLSHSGAERTVKIASADDTAVVKDSVFIDPLCIAKDGGYEFDVFSLSDVNTLYDRIVYATIMDVHKTAGTTIALGGERVKDLTPKKAPLLATKHAVTDIPDSKIVSLEFSGGKIVRGAQWGKLNSALKGNAKNVFIVLSAPEKFITDIDRNAFYGMLENAAKVKNVFVIKSGNENFTTIKNGVRYMSVANSRNEKTIKNSVEKTRYLSFNIAKDGGVTYIFKKLFE